jgi:hypothetical protein
VFLMLGLFLYWLIKVRVVPMVRRFRSPRPIVIPSPSTSLGVNSARDLHLG